MEQSNNLKLPLINVNNAEDLKKTFIDYVKMISGVDTSSALQILDRVITDLQTTKQDKLTAGENITIVGNVISGQGGVEEEDVMDIIENNAEQTNTLDVGTSATFDATSDEQIPTSKAVAGLMASAGGSGGSKLYLHQIKFKINATTNPFYVFISNSISTPFTTNSFNTYMSTNNLKIPFNGSMYYNSKICIGEYIFYNAGVKARFGTIENTIVDNNINSTVSVTEHGFHSSSVQSDTVVEL